MKPLLSVLPLHQLLTFAFFIATSPLLMAQDAIKPILCGNEVFDAIIVKQYPDLKRSFESTFAQAKDASSSRGSDPLTVQVVVHIVWNEEAENLHDSIIHNQLAILNADFNKLNADTTELREVYQPVAASANIQFELAAIERVHTDVLFSVDLFGNNLLPEVKQTDLGGSDGWNEASYINIWVCNIQPIEIFGVVVGQILGFSFPPNNLPNWPEETGAPTPEEDGVVIDYRVFGGNNPNPIENPVDMTPLTVKGRTVVHEVGHYFGLRHIWGDGGALGPNDCAQSDGIDDTPFANAQSNFDCDKSKNSCDVVDTYYNLDMPDLIENFMDYASEDCMNMFTQGQVDLMRNVLNGPREGLLGDPSATDDIVTSEDILISPNPANDVINVRLTGNATNISSLRLMNLDGRMLQQVTMDQMGANVFSMRVADIPQGIYLLQLWDGDRSYVRKVLIHY